MSDEVRKPTEDVSMLPKLESHTEDDIVEMSELYLDPCGVPCSTIIDTNEEPTVSES